MTDMREKARELAVKHGPSRETDAYHMYVRVLTEVRNAALEEAAGVAEELARAHHGHPFINDRFARTQTAEVLADNIRALKDKE